MMPPLSPPGRCIKRQLHRLKPLSVPFARRSRIVRASAADDSRIVWDITLLSCDTAADDGRIVSDHMQQTMVVSSGTSSSFHVMSPLPAWTSAADDGRIVWDHIPAPPSAPSVESTSLFFSPPRHMRPGVADVPNGW